MSEDLRPMTTDDERACMYVFVIEMSWQSHQRLLDCRCRAICTIAENPLDLDRELAQKPCVAIITCIAT